MVLKKVKSSDLKEMDTCQRIRETAINLFALKGFEGASIREIARIAKVNIAAINYHFTSKEKLRQEVTNYIIEDFKNKLSSLSSCASTVEAAVKLHDVLMHDPAKCLNQFKLFIESDGADFDKDPEPVGFLEFSGLFEKDLNPSVPVNERLWLFHVIMSYVIHTSVMSSTRIGDKKFAKFFTEKEGVASYITRLVERMISELNRKYA